jgi:ribosomal protein S18 acetylase RimI-like enzyme
MIRDILEEDLDALVAIEKACFEAGYADHMNTREDFATALADTDQRVFVCIEDGAVAGYASLIFDEHGIPDFDSLAVSPDQQGKGLGEQLFQFVERYCIDNRIPQLNLEIKETNYVLLKRYHRFGYKCFEIVEGFYGDGWSAIRMKKCFAA